MGERNTSPSLLHWWKCAVGQQHTCGMLVFIQHMWNPLCKDTSLAVSERVKPAFWGYFHSCCSHWAHHGAIFLEHGTSVTCFLSVVVADMPLKCIFAFTTFHHQKVLYNGDECQALDSGEHDSFSQAGSEASSQCKCWCARNFLGLLFS